MWKYEGLTYVLKDLRSLSNDSVILRNIVVDCDLFSQIRQFVNQSVIPDSASVLIFLL
jgi:hypothetical protein